MTHPCAYITDIGKRWLKSKSMIPAIGSAVRSVYPNCKGFSCGGFFVLVIYCSSCMYTGFRYYLKPVNVSDQANVEIESFDREMRFFYG